MTLLRSNQPQKGLVLAHLNICSLRNKVHEIANICTTNGIHVLALTETHLDSKFGNSELAVDRYTLFRNDRNQDGGGVAFYIKDYIAVSQRDDLMCTGIEILWLQLHIPFNKPVLVGCCYRPPSSNIEYLEKICENIDLVSAQNKDFFLLGDFNIDWFAKQCSMRKKLTTMSNACNLKQIVNEPTRISMKGACTATCIDHIFTNVHNLCSPVVSIGVGCSDHNLIATTKRTKMPKGGGRIVCRRSYKRFDPNLFIQDVKSFNWSVVCEKDDVNDSLNLFMDMFVKLVNKHAPIRKKTVKSNNAPMVRCRATISNEREGSI